MARGYQDVRSQGLSLTKKVGARNGVPEEPQPRDGTESKRGIEGEMLGGHLPL